MEHIPGEIVSFYTNRARTVAQSISWSVVVQRGAGWLRPYVLKVLSKPHGAIYKSVSHVSPL